MARYLFTLAALAVSLLSAPGQVATFDGGPIQRALIEIKSTYGHEASIERKAKSLNKFGQRSSVGTTYATVAQLQGSEINETQVATNLIDSAVSSNSGDTQTLTLEGHTIDGSGNLTFVVQDVTLTGQTEATLGTPLARATRAYVKNSGTFNSPQAAIAGTVYFYDNTDGIAAGVPNTAAATKLILSAGNTQTEKAATSVSALDYWIIKEGYFGVGRAGGSATTATFRIERRDVANGGVWRPTGSLITVQVGGGSRKLSFDPAIIIPPNHDVRVVAATDANTAAVFAELRGPLAVITQ